MKFIEQAVTQLNGFTNFYWEIANEPDFNPAQNPVNIDAMINWHNAVAQKIADLESTLPNQHAIAANFITQETIDKVKQVGRLNANIKILSSHYVDITPKGGAPARLGAIALNRGYNHISVPTDKIFGFNETKLADYPNTDTPTTFDRHGWRAEAWEFMMSEGGLYDNLGYGWRTTVAGDIRSDLGKLAGYVNSLQLAAMGRETGSTPSWVSGGNLIYDSLDTNPDPSLNARIYWGSMKRPNGGQYVFYMHHSNKSTAAGAVRYLPVLREGAKYYQRNLTFNLAGISPGYYKLDWHYYPPTSSGTQATCSDSVYWNGTAFTKQTPKYSYDLAVRLTRCGTASSPCATATTCP